MSSTVPRRRKLLEPDANQVKIYVRNMPLEKTIEEVRELFGQFGDIHGLQYHTEIKDRIFLVRTCDTTSNHVTFFAFLYR